MQGGAQSHLMICSDSNCWVVKFTNNPQHIRILANEHLATRLARLIGLTVPQPGVVHVPKLLIEQSPELRVTLAHITLPCAAGWQYGSRYVGGIMPGQVMDYLPDKQLMEIRNLAEFAGMLAFDLWTSNKDRRQAVYFRNARERIYTASFIDQGFCFSGGSWRFEDSPLKGMFPRTLVYRNVIGWSDFEPWLSRIEEFEPTVLWKIAKDIPGEWYDDNFPALSSLLEGLFQRRLLVRSLIHGICSSRTELFPKWIQS